MCVRVCVCEGVRDGNGRPSYQILVQVITSNDIMYLFDCGSSNFLGFTARIMWWVWLYQDLGLTFPR